jgi:hypothetical protein
MGQLGRICRRFCISLRIAGRQRPIRPNLFLRTEAVQIACTDGTGEAHQLTTRRSMFTFATLQDGALRVIGTCHSVAFVKLAVEFFGR